MARFNTSQRFRPWIQQVARNAARDFLRKRKHQASSLDSDQLASVTPAPQHRLEEGEQLAALHGCLQQLTNEERTVILLLQDGLSQGEIGKMIGRSEPTVSNIKQRAVLKLFKCMASKGYH